MIIRWMALLTLVTIVLFTSHLCATKSPGKQSATIVAFSIEGERGVDSISVYSESSGNRCVIKSSGFFDTELYGYETRSDTWVLGTPISGSYLGNQLVRVKNGKKSIIHLADFPEHGSVQMMASTAGILTVSIMNYGSLLVQCYNLDGSLISRRSLRVPHDMILEDDACHVTLTRSGLVAAAPILKSTMRSELCVFDSKGVIKDRIGRGIDPEFDPKGQRVAFRDCVVMRKDAASGDQTTICPQPGTIVIYDLKSKARRVIAAENPPDVARNTLDLSRFQWSPDGQCLVCSYMQGDFAEHLIYVIDITSEKPRWKRLPVQSGGGFWTVVEKMPRLYCREK